LLYDKGIDKIIRFAYGITLLCASFDSLTRSGMQSDKNTNDKAATLRPRGRPFKTEADHAEVRNKILAATAAAYGELGYHGLTVEAIVKKAGLSRPTFYRHFANCEEPVRIAIARAHDGLIEQLVNRIPVEAEIEEKMTLAISLYLEWGKSIGPLLRPLYIELHDPMSPVSELRPQVLRRIGDIFTKMLQMSGIKVPNPLLVELVITGIEFLGYRYHFEQSPGKISRPMINDAISRQMACMLLRN
jgi:TetR/AcrR family transcriptional regulator